MTSVQEEIATLRAAARLLLERAERIPGGPWYLKQVVGRTAVCDTSGHIIAWVPDATGADTATFLATRDRESAQLEAALLNAVADGAEWVMRTAPSVGPIDYAEALALATHLMEAPS